MHPATWRFKGLHGGSCAPAESLVIRCFGRLLRATDVTPQICSMRAGTSLRISPAYACIADMGIPFSKTDCCMPKHTACLVPASPRAVPPASRDSGQRFPLHRRFRCPRNSRPPRYRPVCGRWWRGTELGFRPARMPPRAPVIVCLISRANGEKRHTREHHDRNQELDIPLDIHRAERDLRRLAVAYAIAPLVLPGTG